MEPTASFWEGILRRASSLRQRYGNLADAPHDTWSLVNRVAAEKFAGQAVPAARDRGHALALWSKALVSVLNDLHRKQRRRALLTGARVPLADGEEVAQAASDGPDERLQALETALADLARQDEAMGENKALIVALKYFEGLTWEQLATTLGSSVHRVRDEWEVARAWLRRELRRRGFQLD